MKNPVKKILCTVMALLVVGTSSVVFTGCGKDSSSSESSSSKVETTEETTTSEPTTVEETTVKETTVATTKATEAGVSADFKATMDSYEEFFNDYVDFMKKYQNSSDVMSMASDYADYMSKYSDMMNKLNAIKSEDLSTADLAYYTEVNARITKKLAEVAN